LTAHDDSEDSANENELTECVGETSEDFYDGEREQVDREGKASAIAVGNEAKYNGPDRPERQGCRKRKRDRFVVFGEAMADGREAEDYKEEIEPVESPARKCTYERAYPPITCRWWVSKRLGSGDHRIPMREESPITQKAEA
jgi:hypothetical protein